MPYRTVSGARKRVPSLKNLSDKQVTVFIAVFNDLVKKGEEEDKAFPKAIAAAKKTEKSTMPLTPIIKALNEEEQISYEVIYEPYKLDAQDQWMRPETIRKACESFNENLALGVVKPNLFHAKDDEGEYTHTEDFTVEKTWINEVESTIGDQVVPEGTWLCKLKWNDPEAWDKRKAGIFQGVSLGGLGSVKAPTQED